MNLRSAKSKQEVAVICIFWNAGIESTIRNIFFVIQITLHHVKLQIITTQTFSHVKVKEVTVENCLHAAGNNGDRVEGSFQVISIYPVEDIESTIGTQSKQIVACNCLRFPSLGDHK